jgi:hypothetical protein
MLVPDSRPKPTPRSWLGLLIALTLGIASCGDPGFRIDVINGTSDGWLVRTQAGPHLASVVFDSPPGSTGTSWQSAGPFDGTVEILARDCSLIGSIKVLADNDDVLVTFRDGTAPASSVVPFTDTTQLNETSACLRK